MDLSANKVNSTSQSIKIDKLNSSEWNQLVTEYNNVLSKAGITPSSSTLTQFKSAVEEIFDDTYELESENDGWEKPSDWIDIRSGALSNSVYFLVAHSAPTGSAGSYTIATYPQFAVKTTISNSGTYDVFVDGMKVATTNSGSNTIVDWAALYNNGTLISGYDVTYPSALTTHVVRVTPSLDSNIISAIQCGSLSVTQGILWAHFTTQESISLDNAFNFVQTLEVATCSGETLKVSNLDSAFRFASALKSLCPLEGDGSAISSWNAFRTCKFKELQLKNITFNNSDSLFQECTNLQDIVCDNVNLKVGTGTFIDCSNLKKLPSLVNNTNASTSYPFLSYASVLEDTVLDLSYAQTFTRFAIYGNSTNRIDGLKGLILSSEAPFDNTTSPQLNVSYTGLDKQALVTLFESMPTVTNNQICSIVGCTGTPYLTQEDKNIVLNKGWQLTVE